MRAALLAPLAACWTSTASPREVSVAKPKQCAIRGTDVTVDGAVKLSVSELTFAFQSNPFSRLDVTFVDAIGRARVENDRFVLEGELDLEIIAVRKREQELHDGWIEIRKGKARAATGDELRVEVELPDGLDPKSRLVTFPCGELTFEGAPDPGAEEGEIVELPINTVLRATPDGPPVARVVGRHDPDDPAQPLSPLAGQVIDRRGSMTQVWIEGDNPVTAWASSLALLPGSFGGLGGFGFGRTSDPRTPVTCSRDVPIQVRVQGRARRVGHVKRGVQFHRGAESSGSDVPIDLGIEKPDVQPFISATDFQACE